MRSTRILSAAFAIWLLFAFGCSNPTDTKSTQGRIKISVKGVAGSSTAGLGKAAGAVTVTSVRVVIEKIELKNSVKDSVDFEMKEPFVQDLAADSTLYALGTVEAPFGTYREMEIKIDELDEQSAAAFAQHPELQHLSVYAEGFLNGDSSRTFVFTSDLSVEQEKEFQPPLQIDENNPSTNIVLLVDISTWFVDEKGSPIDPTVEDNRSQIESNIKSSFKVFEDHDDDGKEDDDD